MENFEGVKGVWLDGKWVALSDLEKEENTVVGKQHLRSPIAVVPSEGYASKENYSKISIQWLEWLMERSRQRGKPVHIRHALNGGEYRVRDTNYRCDGFVENPKGKRTIYEFYDELFKITKKRERELKELGYNLVVVWEHQFRYQLEKNADLQQFINTLDLQDRLVPRDSFFGGRTNAIKLHYKAKEDETIQYYDFTSLYPWTNKYCRYPVGERAITGTWCTPEIQMAVSKGYQILKIYEVYYFEQSTQYDPTSGEGGLFANPCFDEMMSSIPRFNLHQGLPSREDIEQYTEGVNHTIVVLDDLMLQVAQSQDCVPHFTVTSHHRNVTTVMLSQTCTLPVNIPGPYP
uniref:DNA-directed DNA polymerase n=1 Tax=Magallana gigas TaxID=29159 RepID=A0A8W8IHN1_MAGGI